MSAMIEILKRIQQDIAEQKDYMRNLHVIHKNINEKFNIMERKIDQQRVTIEMLEQQVRKNNVLLFGNDEAEIHYEDKSNLYNKDVIADFVNQSEKCKEDTEVSQLQNDFEVTNVVECNPQINAEQYDNIKSDKNKIGEFTASEVKEIKQLIRDHVATTESSVKETASQVCKQETVQISSVYFSTDQMNKLNAELKRIAEKYQSTNIFPVIEVIPGPLVNNHPVMADLSRGVYYKGHNGYQGSYKIYLGSKGFRRSDILEMIMENPNLTLNDVVIEGLKCRNEWPKPVSNINYMYDFSNPFLGSPKEN